MNAVLGVLAKVSPQMNMFSGGNPVKDYCRTGGNAFDNRDAFPECQI